MSDASPYRVEGALTSDVVPARWRETRRWQRDGVPAVIDLSGVEQADSSGVALLLEWLGWARALGGSVRFLNAPEGLSTIAALSQVDELLGLEENHA